jgi:expansin (peptidoglycan-binding protein)
MGVFMRTSLLFVFALAIACSSKSTSTDDASTTTHSSTSSTSSATSSVASVINDAGITLYGSAYSNVNMWYGPVDYAESKYHNACGLEDGEKYPALIQQLYGNYIIGLDGANIANVASHCDDCAQLTANGLTIIAHIVTYGTEKGVDAIDLSPEAQTALGLSSSNWTGTWQFCSCPTTAPMYYEFDGRQWNPQNFWYLRVWTRNQRIPVTLVESQIGTGGWQAASQQSDGAWQTVSGVDFSGAAGAVQLRVTGQDGTQIIDTMPSLPTYDPTQPFASHTNFQ